MMYEYNAVVVGVYDGDTITVDVDLGLHAWVRGEKLRLYGINAPEVRGSERQEGLRSRDWLRDRLPIGQAIRINTVKDRTGKYGRYLAIVYADRETEISVNCELVTAGLASYAEY